MKRAALYSRVSSEIQAKERTIESQVSELKRHIDKAGETLVQEYIDNGHSGALLDRPAMNKLRDDLKTNTYDIIYFLAADRIARDVSYQNIIIGEILRHKKEIVIAGENYQHNPENKFNLTVMGAVSELERAKIVERSQRGRKYKLKQGILMSNGSKLYGYSYHRKTMSSSAFYTVNRREAKIVKYIFETYASGNLEKDAYLKRIEAYDKTIEKLEGQQQELDTKTPVTYDSQVIDKALVKYCNNIKTELVETNTVKAKRRFLLNHISKITYQNNKVTVCGSIPIGSGFVEFEIKYKINREALRAEILAHDRANGHRGMPIRREEFGQLKANAEVTN